MELKDTIDLMLSDDFKDRFCAEYHQIDIRMKKLGVMLKRWERGDLDFKPTAPKTLLYSQYAFMQAYLSTLVKRAEIEGIDLREVG